MQRLPVNALRAFATVYARGGIRPAARELGIVHSAVARHVSELEAWLGVRLMERDAARRALVFTPQGEALGKAAAAGFADLERAVAAVRELKPAGAVTLACAPSFAVRWLLPLLPRLERSHPQLEVSVLVDQRLIDLDASGVDMAIRMGAGGWTQTRNEPLMDDALYPVVSPAGYTDRDRPWTPEDLLDQRLLHDRDPQASWEMWRQAFGPAALDVRAGPRFTSSDLVLRAAAQGQGVALARHRLVAEDLASGALVRPIEGLQITLRQAYWIALPPRRRVSLATRTLIAWLKEQVQL